MGNPSSFLSGTMSQEDPLENNHDDTNGSSTGGGSSSVRGDSGHAEPESLPEDKEVPKKTKSKKPASSKKPAAGAGRSAAAKKAAATRKAKEEKLAKLEERLSFFENIYQQAEAEVGAAGAEEPEEQEEAGGGGGAGGAGGTGRPGDSGYHPGVGELEETEAILDQGAGAGDMDSSAGASRAPATPQRRRFTARRSGGAFNRRLYDKLAATQGAVVSARGKVGGRKQLSSLFRKVHRGMSDEELSRFAIGSIRQNQYA